MSDHSSHVSSLLEHFESAWRRGERPAIEDVLPDHPGLRPELLGHLAPMELELRLKAGEETRVEDYLRRFPELGQGGAGVLTLCEVEYRFRRGDDARADLLNRFPQFREALVARLSTVAGLTPAPPGAPPLLPENFGRYRIRWMIGEGAMGRVYLAFDTHLHRPVALKASNFTAASPHLLARFLIEARAAAVLHHPHLCPVYEAGEIDGIAYLTMPYLEGKPLTRAFPPPLPQGQAAELVRTLALAMHEAHPRHVVHRDLKPNNILVDRRGVPTVLDFGLAMRLRPDDDPTRQPGRLVGTPAYMPPEQARGELDQMGPRSDVYSLGVILYELLTGKVPFRGDVDTVIWKVIWEKPEPPGRHRPDLDPNLEAVCLKAMGKEPADRIPDMESFARALGDWLEGIMPPPPPPPASAAPDPRVANDVLGLLHEWGWEAGLARLRAEAAGSDD